MEAKLCEARARVLKNKYVNRLAWRSVPAEESSRGTLKLAGGYLQRNCILFSLGATLLKSKSLPLPGPVVPREAGNMKHRVLVL